MQSGGSRWEMGQIVKICKKIQMNQKESFNSTVKNHDLNTLVSFDCRNHLVHLRKHFWTEDVERRVVECDSPILGRVLDQMYLSSLRRRVTLIFHTSYLVIVWTSGLGVVLRSCRELISSRRPW